MSARVYPLPRPDGDDPRFNFGLLHEVAKVITTAGYPPVTAGADLLDLQQVLYRFIYAADETPAATHRARRLDADVVVCAHCTQVEGARILWPCLAYSAAEVAADFAAAPVQAEDQPTTSARGHGQAGDSAIEAQRAELHLDLSDELLRDLALHAAYSPGVTA